MIKLTEGQKVHYVPFKDADPSTYENGIVKRVIEEGGYQLGAFVVYNCAGEWSKINDYTAARTDIIDLREGWTETARNSFFCFPPCDVCGDVGGKNSFGTVLCSRHNTELANSMEDRMINNEG